MERQEQRALTLNCHDISAVSCCTNVSTVY